MLNIKKGDFIRSVPKKGGQMKKSMILPIILALGVGMSFAQTVNEPVKGQKLVSDTSVTILDETRFIKAPKKGITSTSITAGDVTYTQCVNDVCKDVDFLDPVYSWEKRDLSSGEWSALMTMASIDSGWIISRFFQPI